MKPYVTDPKDGSPLCHGNPASDFHLVKTGTYATLLCGFDIPWDQTTMSVKGQPTCPRCLELLKDEVRS